MPSTNAADVVGQANQQNAALGLLTQQILRSNAATQSASSQEQDVVNQEANEAGIVKRTEESGALEAQTGSRTFANAAGTNVSDPAEIMTGLAAQLNDAYSKADAASNKLADIATNSPIKASLANTLLARGKSGGAIIGSLLLGGANAQLSAQQERIKLLSGQIHDLNVATQETAKTQSDIAPIRTTASASAAADLAANAFTEKSLQLKQQAAQLNISGVQAVAAMGQQQLGNSINAENLELSAAQKDLMRKNLDIEIADRLDRVKIRDETEAGLTQIATLVQNGIKQLNPGNGVLNFPPQKIIQMIKADPDSFKAYLRIGIQSQITGNTQISTDPGESALIIDSTNAPLAPAQKSVRNLLMNSLSLANNGEIATVNKDKAGNDIVTAPTKNPTFNPKDKDQLKFGASSNAYYAANADAKNIDFANNSNIYQAPTLNSIAQLKGMEGNKFFETVIKPQVKSSAALGTDPNALFNQALNAVSSGQLSFSEAVNGLSLTFNAATKLNNAMKQYDSVGLKMQKSYNTAIKSPVGGSTIIDMTNTAQISAELSKQLALKQMQENPSILSNPALYMTP